MNEKIINNWVTYILELSDESYYTGITNNLHKRLEAHKSGNGSKYVVSRLPCSVVYICYEKNRSEASRREANIKKLSRKNKELVVKGMWYKDDDKINLFCGHCGAVISMNKDKVDCKINLKCLVCNNSLNYEEEDIKHNK